MTTNTIKTYNQREDTVEMMMTTNTIKTYKEREDTVEMMMTTNTIKAYQEREVERHSRYSGNDDDICFRLLEYD